MTLQANTKNILSAELIVTIPSPVSIRVPPLLAVAVRLRSHIAQLGKFLEAEEPIGRKMDFLVQEINREANTIGSKASDVAIGGKVIDIKAEVEKIREQIQNIE